MYKLFQKNYEKRKYIKTGNILQTFVPYAIINFIKYNVLFKDYISIMKIYWINIIKMMIQLL